MKKFLATAFLLASVLPVAAQTAVPAPTNGPVDTTVPGQPIQGQPMHHQDWSPECKTKIEQMCPSIQPGVRPAKGAVHDCLKAKNTTFAQVCPAEAAAFKAEREERRAGQVPPPAPGSAPVVAPVVNGQPQ